MTVRCDASSTSIDRIVTDRRSIRAFRPDPVPLDVVVELLELAAWSPSPHNSQPWRFTVLTCFEQKRDLALAMAGRLAADLTADGVTRDVIERQTRRSTDRITSAPVVVLCSLVTEGLTQYPDEKMNRLEWDMAVQSVGAVLQTLFLLATEREIGSCWMAAPMYCPDEVRSSLSLPMEYRPQALALLGYPANQGKVRPRRPACEVIHVR